MYQVHDWSQVRRLDREGLSKRAIARRLQMSRTTVYRLLALSEPPAYEREPAASFLHPSRAQFSRCCARTRAPRRTASTLLSTCSERATVAASRSSRTTWRACARSSRPPCDYGPHDVRARPAPPGRLVGHRRRRAGRQGCEERRAHGLVTTLPFSAAHAVVYAHSQTTADAVPALYGCLERLGGVPQRLVVDNDASLVVRRGRARPRPVDELAGLLGTLAMAASCCPRGARRAREAWSAQRLPRGSRSCRCATSPTSPTCRRRATPGCKASPGARHLRRLGTRVREALAVERAELAPLPDAAARPAP